MTIGWMSAAIDSLPPNVPQEVVYHQKRTDGWKTLNEKRTAWVVKTDPE